MAFEFATANRIIFGPGKSAEIGQLAKPLGRRALVVTGGSARPKKLIEILEEQGIEVLTFPVFGEPDTGLIQNGVALAKKGVCDLVVSIGGGSALDTGKAIAALLTNYGELFDYLEVVGSSQPLARPSAPFIAVPTTAGTGSEVTRNAVIAAPIPEAQASLANGAVTQAHIKVSLRSPLMLPRIALVDPELTYDLPPMITARTGMDALTQLIEPFVCSRANPLTDALCRQCIPWAGRSLAVAFRDGRDEAARQDMAFASLCGGLALANAGLGVVHGFAGPIGGMFSAPHGAICGALLAPGMEGNIRALHQRQPGCEALERYAEIARMLTGKRAARLEDGVAWIHSLSQELQIPPLSRYGITREHVTQIVKAARGSNSMKANPIVLTDEELAAILQAAL